MYSQSRIWRLHLLPCSRRGVPGLCILSHVSGGFTYYPVPGEECQGYVFSVTYLVASLITLFPERSARVMYSQSRIWRLHLLPCSRRGVPGLCILSHVSGGFTYYPVPGEECQGYVFSVTYLVASLITLAPREECEGYVFSVTYLVASLITLFPERSARVMHLLSEMT